jgi:hypothetical protein
MGGHPSEHPRYFQTVWGCAAGVYFGIKPPSIELTQKAGK